MTTEVQGFVGMGTYIVEGIVEQDPMTDRYVIRTEDQTGKPFSFDVQAALAGFVGKDIRVVLTPVATVEELERLVKQQQAEGQKVESGEAPPEGRKIEITSAMSGGKGSMSTGGKKP